MKNTKIETSLVDILHNLVYYVESTRDFNKLKNYFFDSLYYSGIIDFQQRLMLYGFFNSVDWNNLTMSFYIKDTDTLVDCDYIFSYIDNWE